jgi:hypothetical protein
MWQEVVMSEVQGREFDWFALDSEGNLALFATAGEGFIPAEVASFFPMHDAVSESLPAPHTGTAQVWSDYAAQGLFVFDWDLPGGPYIRRAVPSWPLHGGLRARIMAIQNIPSLKGSFAGITELRQWHAA